MYKTLLVTLFAALATAQVTKLNKSQASVLNLALESVQASVRSDPAWSSIYSIMATATGAEGFAATYIRNGGSEPITVSVTDTAAFLASRQSKWSSIVTQLPTQAYASYESLASIEAKIISSVFSAASVEAAGLTVTAASTSSPSHGTTISTSSQVQITSNTVIAVTTSKAVVSTAGGERIRQLGCGAAIGVLGAGAILL